MLLLNVRIIEEILQGHHWEIWVSAASGAVDIHRSVVMAFASMYIYQDVLPSICLFSSASSYQLLL